MKLAVKSYKDRPETAEAKAGIPGDWPAEVLELRDGDVAPVGWTELTRDEYQARVESLRSQVEAWQRAKDATEETERADKLHFLRAQQNAMLTQLKTAEANWTALTADDRLQATRQAVRLVCALAVRLETIRPLSPEDTL